MTGPASDQRPSTGVSGFDGGVKGRLPEGLDRLLVLGGGYTGQRFAHALAEREVPVLLSHRQAEPPAAPPGGRWIRFDGAAGVCPGAAELAGVSHVLVTIPPGEGGDDPVLRHLHGLLRQLQPAWVGVLSTTGVYGDQQGRWVDETAALQASPGRSQARLLAERAWHASGLPVQVFRLPAIYGPGRSPFAALLEGRARLIHKPGQVFSRIHVDDIVGALLHNLALDADQRPPTLNLADAEPCPSSETLGYAAHLLGCPLPAVERFADIADGMSAMARSFWMENRRADSRLLREGLGYALRYPSYREGYREGCRSDWVGPKEGRLKS
ncbi:MAG: SDR family NAD(P)-dependent oxidoreductase [Cyanobacteriota bacterium]|nr:SDR family NAD(P)-dependent oxidoreductase [Cyanobacteriota bacterium]